MNKTAVINGNYRYLLGREWNVNKQQVTFVMLNPSTADASKDDRTLCRCISFAKSWGYGSLEVVNLFAYRATKPHDMRSSDEPVGSENDHYIQSATKRASLIIVAWGQHGGFQNRNIKVLDLISGKSLYCLGLTKHGHPRHPLCIAKNTQLLLFCK